MDISPDELQSRIESLQVAYTDCRICSRDCGVDRTMGPAGACGLDETANCYKEFLHYGEEAELVPSHVIYLTGCSMRCVFCSDDRYIRQPQLGVQVTSEDLAARIARRRAEGARTVNFVGGEPSVNLLAILRALSLVPMDTRVVWNTNLLIPPRTVDLLSGVVDVWVADAKFGNDRCARLGGVKGYLSATRTALRRVADSGAQVIVRHLLMPGHLDCCTLPVISQIETDHPQFSLNLMTRYVPFAGARSIPTMNRKNSEGEVAAALDALRGARLRALVDGVRVSTHLGDSERH